MPKNYSVQEVADIFKRSPDTIRRWINEGRVFREAYKIKGAYLIPRHEVERIICEGKVSDLNP